MSSTPEEILAIVERIKPLLAGRPPEVQGGVLADCLAIWLVGYQVEDDAEATRQLRAELLRIHCYAVLQLIEVNDKIIGTPDG